jgi:hypothetical protein
MLRQEMNLPQNPPQPQEEPSSSQPRHSGHEKRPVVHPDNVYRSLNSTQSEQISNREFREIIEGVPAPSGSGNRPDSVLMKEKANNMLITWSEWYRKEVLASQIFY